MRGQSRAGMVLWTGASLPRRAGRAGAEPAAHSAPKPRQRPRRGQQRAGTGHASLDELLVKIKSELHKLGPLIDLDATRESQGVEDRLPVTERTGAKQDERAKGGPTSPGA
jgi:hypothetical protein